MPEPVDSKALARHMGVTVATVRRWVRERRIPFIRISRRVVRFDLDAIKSILQQGGPADDQ